MAISYKMHIILGLQVIVLINLSQSFVLLTANMEDVRKLAKKFVSESLAEQIADFIAKVTSTSGNTANVSEENEENANLYHEISSEDLYRSNKAKPRSPNKEEAKKSPPSRTQTTKHERMTTERSRWPNYINHNKRTKQTKSRQGIIKHSHNSWNKPSKHRLSGNVLDENNNRDVTTEPEKKEEDHPEMSIDIDPAPISENVEATIKPTKHRRKPKRKPEKAAQLVNNIPDSTIGYAEKFEFDENPNPGRHKLSQLASEEINETNSNDDLTKNFYDTSANLSKTTTLKYEGFNIGRSGREMTTEKEKNDFDQYDNKNYPKSEFVATSGPVVLPKVPAQSQWWEKEVLGTGKGKEQKRKAWF
ncbi:uncharacterized protein LOC135085385 [Ostrinia nubilalis]|uniref:uncharacterized protein LOC135085385 n=1 Tax=Ostrinia nubilalis TaxID=29057 RepID=UPI00308269AC